jgi:hypothetical protein
MSMTNTMTNEKAKVLEVLRKLEKENNVRVLYCTKSGSKLYGTENPNSDTDYKFVFAPTKTDVLLKQDVEFLKEGSDTKEKNGADDVDFEDTLDEVQDVLGHVDMLLEHTTLPEESDRAFMNFVTLQTLGEDSPEVML